MKKLIDFDGRIENIPEGTPFFDKIRDEGRLLDIPSILIVPSALIGVFQLPQETRWELAFTYSDPTLLTAFTANYVHITRSHLLSNLVGYLLLVVVAYLLALSNSNQMRLYTTLGVILFVFPVLLSYLNLAVPRPGTGFGFSGLNMALFGFVLVEFAAYLETYFTTNFGVENSPSFFFIVMAFVALPYADMRGGFGIIAISMALAVIYSAACLVSYRPTVATIRKSIDKQGYFELLVVVAILCPAFVAMAFPQNPVMKSTIVNLYAHLIGFCLGFITVYSWVLFATPASLSDALPFSA